jgi:hypothetical protein
MVADLRRAAELFCTGRSRKAALAEIAAVCAVTPVLWFAACVAVLLGPLP